MTVCSYLTYDRHLIGMLKWIFTLCVAIGMAFAAIRANASDLIVNVNGVRNGHGEVRFGLYNNPQAFPNGKKLRGQEEAANKGVVQTIFRNLPPGTYAVAVHHDENSDKKMNLRLFIFPQEGYGFSNNARAVLAPPTFQAAAFNMGDSSLAIALTVVY